MAQTKPTILIVHGAWHHPGYYSKVIEPLESQGYEVLCPRLPTCNNAIPPDQKLSDDVALIRSTVQKLADVGKEVIVLCHSYGGIISTDALYGFSIEKRAEEKLKGGVKAIIFMAAFVPKKGEGLAGIFGGGLPPWIQPMVYSTSTLLHTYDLRFHSRTTRSH